VTHVCVWASQQPPSNLALTEFVASTGRDTCSWRVGITFANFWAFMNGHAGAHNARTQGISTVCRTTVLPQQKHSITVSAICGTEASALECTLKEMCLIRNPALVDIHGTYPKWGFGHPHTLPRKPLTFLDDLPRRWCW